MEQLGQLQALIGVLVLVVVVAVFSQRAFGRARGRRPSTNSNVLEVMDEVFSPTRHTAALELRSQQEQGSVTPVPDDWLPPDRDGLDTHVADEKRAAPTHPPHSTGDTAHQDDGFRHSRPRGTMGPWRTST
jgi:hypothetical protein